MTGFGMTSADVESQRRIALARVSVGEALLEVTATEAQLVLADVLRDRLRRQLDHDLEEAADRTDELESIFGASTPPPTDDAAGLRWAAVVDDDIAAGEIVELNPANGHLRRIVGDQAVRTLESRRVDAAALARLADELDNEADQTDGGWTDAAREAAARIRRLMPDTHTQENR